MPRIAILGAGLIGLACAWHLARDGHRVVLLDASHEPRESSWAAAGMLAPHHEAAQADPLWRLCRDGLACWPPFLEVLGLSPEDADWRAGGGWIRSDDAAELDRLEGGLRWLRSTGTEVLRLSPAAYARACPGVEPGAGALWLPGAQVDPRRVLPVLRAACQAAGVVDASGSPVTALEAGGARTADGALHATDELVLASGAWSPALAALAGMHLTGTPVKGQMVRLAGPGPCGLPGFVRQDHRYLMSRRDGSVVVGATMVESGFDRSEDPAAIAALAAWAGQAVPALAGAALGESWTGLRPRLASGLPTLGRVRPGLCVATGHFRNGVLLAPLTGLLIADIVAGRDVRDAALAFDPSAAMG
jgi:glycine oxidase